LAGGQPSRTAIQHGSQLDQAVDCDLSDSRGDRCTHCGVAHPFRNLAGQTRPDLDVEDLTTGTSMPATQANTLTAKRMPRIRHDNKLRSVCRMTRSLAI
jgi:hypothetical protein